MNANGKPKFCVGEQVIIEKAGIISEIQKIYPIEGKWYYGLAECDELYLEKHLTSFQDSEEIVFNREKVDIEYKFQFGDIVRVQGYGQELFVIIGFRAEIWRYRESAWEDIVYELSHIKDGQWLEASEEELTYITNEANARKLLAPIKNKSRKNQITLSHQRVQVGRNGRKELMDIDKLLDMYNDYYSLYKNFGELSYKKKMKEILKKLEALSQNPYKKEK